MISIKPYILTQFGSVACGFSTKIGLTRKPPYNFNLSHSVGDDAEIVEENRKEFFSAFGLDNNSLVFQKQIHSDIITYAGKPGSVGESDALITDKPNLGLVISAADCVPVFMYDAENKVIAGVHSGWRGTQKQILKKTLMKLQADFSTKPESLYVYIGPSISQKNYEVGAEVAELFEDRYLESKSDGKYLLDVSAVNYDALLNFGVPEHRIQLSTLCTYDNGKLLHSYRREGAESGRSLGVIVMK